MIQKNFSLMLIQMTRLDRRSERLSTNHLFSLWRIKTGRRDRPLTSFLLNRTGSAAIDRNKANRWMMSYLIHLYLKYIRIFNREIRLFNWVEKKRRSILTSSSLFDLICLTENKTSIIQFIFLYHSPDKCFDIIFVNHHDAFLSFAFWRTSDINSSLKVDICRRRSWILMFEDLEQKTSINLFQIFSFLSVGICDERRRKPIWSDSIDSFDENGSRAVTFIDLFARKKKSWKKPILIITDDRTWKGFDSRSRREKKLFLSLWCKC